jgi:asparagine synthase (glutamine-hydrolysing)
MCGICGIVHRDPEFPIDPATLDSMMDTLAHRGPDGRGVHVAGGVGLGHRRLSIIDLTGGAQPMYNEDRSIAIVFNGEIYNYLELIPELRARGHQFASVCDTEVIIHLYEELGPECVERLNGMFAFAVWDGRTRSLLLARDRLGKKPLYYATVGDRLVFASELKALLGDPAFRAEVDVAALDDYLSYGYVPGEECILRGVRKLPPGSILEWRDGRLEVRRYWSPSWAQSDGAARADGAARPDDAARTDIDEWSADLLELLRDAVRVRLRSDVPLGVFLSGGVDSSAIVALASGCTTQPVRTFSVGFEETDYSELAYARMVAQRYGTRHTEIIVRDHDLGVLPDLVYHLDEPFADPSALPTYYVCREARRHVTVCLSGDGGDEVFAGYARYAQGIRHARWERWVRLAGRPMVGAVAQVYPRRLPGRGAIERMRANGAHRYALQVGLFPEAERRALLRPELQDHLHATGALFEPLFRATQRAPLLSVMQHVDQRTYLPDDILVKVDRMSMMSSLEVRAPLLDYRVVERVNAAPADFKLRAGEGKYVLKRLLEPLLPGEVLHRRKMGFGIPLRHWFRGRHESTLRERLLAPDARLTRWLEPEAIRAVVEDALAGGRDLSRRAWTLLVLEEWCRRFGL